MIRNSRGQTIIVACIIAFVLYIIYSQMSAVETRGMADVHAWKSVEHDKVPDEVLKRAEDVAVKKTNIDVRAGGVEVVTAIRVVESYDQKIQRTPVLLLHGRAFSSKTWHDLKTLQLIGALGHKAVAVDLPGYGESPNVDGLDKALYLRELIKELDIPRPILVTASMSGSFVIPYVMNEHPERASQRATALVAIAPVQTKTYTHQQYSRLEIPVLIIRGEKDTSLGLEASSSLQNSVSNKYVEFKDGGHACYTDDPKRWHLELYNFLLGLEQIKLQELTHA